MSPVSGSTIVPPSVPKAIVYTGMPASAASAAPSDVRRPTVVSPSLSSTITPGGRSESSSGSAALTSSFVPAERASPIAVDSASSRLSMPRSIVARSSVGSTSTPTEPENPISPTSTPGSTRSTKSRAASWAASNRRGSTSSAIIDSDTSNSTRIRPSVVVFSVVRSTGRATATTASANPSNCSPATTWRRQRGRFGCDLVEQVDLREAHRRRSPPAQDDHVQHGEPGDEQEQPQRPGARKSVLIGRSRRRGRPAPAGAGCAGRSRRASRRRSTTRSRRRGIGRARRHVGRVLPARRRRIAPAPSP